MAPAYFFSKHQPQCWQEQPALLVPSYNSQLVVLNRVVGSARAGLKTAVSSSLFTALPGSCVSCKH